MIDLHIHTKYSDGTDSVIQLLKKAEKMKLEYISITDHDNCLAYEELKQIEVKKYYSGKIITGIEFKVGYGKNLIEILGYNFDTDKMNKWIQNYYKDKSREIIQTKYFNKQYDICLEMNLKMPKKEDILFNPKNDWASLTIYNAIKQDISNKEKLPEDLWQDFSVFSKKYCGDVNYPLYINKTDDYPTLNQIINIIKQCGGLVFLPHIFIYSWAKDKKQLLKDITNKYKFDGIECYHSTFSNEDSKYLLEFCKENNYYISGGSDYHGNNKENVYLGKLKNNKTIKKEILDNWYKS